MRVIGLLVLAMAATMTVSAYSAPLLESEGDDIAPVPVDVAVIFDNSGSMRKYVRQVRQFLTDLNTSLQAQNTDPRFGLVKFGSVERVMTDLTDFDHFMKALKRCHGRSGAPERGSSALLMALDRLSFREGAVRNIILISDDTDDSQLAAYEQAMQALNQPNTIFNYIGVPGRGNMDARYGTMAATHGGLGFTIDELRGNPTLFANQFAEQNLQQIESTIPEPAALTLLAVGALALLRRR